MAYKIKLYTLEDADKERFFLVRLLSLKVSHMQN